MQERSASVSVVVPVFNSAGTLAPLVERLHTALANTEHEILLVDDGSEDGSWARIVTLAEGDERVRGLSLARNFGQHNALLAGLRAARFDTVVTLDDDLQNPPEEVPKLLARLEEGVDVVYGRPRERRRGLWRDLGSRLTRFALRGA